LPVIAQLRRKGCYRRTALFRGALLFFKPCACGRLDCLLTRALFHQRPARLDQVIPVLLSEQRAAQHGRNARGPASGSRSMNDLQQRARQRIRRFPLRVRRRPSRRGQRRSVGRLAPRSAHCRKEVGGIADRDRLLCPARVICQKLA